MFQTRRNKIVPSRSLHEQRYKYCFTWNEASRAASAALDFPDCSIGCLANCIEFRPFRKSYSAGSYGCRFCFWHLLISGELWQHVKVSAGRALLGLFIGGGLGLLLGLLNGSSRFASTLLDTTLQMIRNIPTLALIPLVILWFGIDETAKLFLVAVGVFFPIYINTYHGIRSVDPQLIEMGKSYGLSRWQLYKEIILPGAMPSILVGLRFALGLVWVLLIVAETISAQAGIGYMTMNAREFLQTDVVLVGILLYALLGKLADVLAQLLERYLLRWHAGYQK